MSRLNIRLRPLLPDLRVCRCCLFARADQHGDQMMLPGKVYGVLEGERSRIKIWPTVIVSTHGTLLLIHLIIHCLVERLVYDDDGPLPSPVYISARSPGPSIIII